MMILKTDENNNNYVHMDIHTDFVDELFLAKLYSAIEDLEGYINVCPEYAHPDDLVVYIEQLAAHKKLLEYYTVPL
jgi:hypothetical protein|tara:strand:- start:1125 stop:1352 length:228 start_codon:yes stop_codon:yes gene_type:complete